MDFVDAHTRLKPGEFLYTILADTHRYIYNLIADYRDDDIEKIK